MKTFFIIGLSSSNFTYSLTPTYATHITLSSPPNLSTLSPRPADPAGGALLLPGPLRHGPPPGAERGAGQCGGRLRRPAHHLAPDERRGGGGRGGLRTHTSGTLLSGAQVLTAVTPVWGGGDVMPPGVSGMRRYEPFEKRSLSPPLGRLVHGSI